MDKMKMETPDGTAENIKKLLELFPECATEVDNGGATQGVNFKILKQLLSPDVIDKRCAPSLTARLCNLIRL